MQTSETAEEAKSKLLQKIERAELTQDVSHASFIKERSPRSPRISCCVDAFFPAIITLLYAGA
jgi:hypothetical protein